MRLTLFTALALALAGCQQKPTTTSTRWIASPATMTFNGDWCADRVGPKGYARVWRARKDGYCYEADAPKGTQP